MNPANELRCLEFWNKLATEQLAGYPRTAAQDRADLASDRLAPFSNERHAIIMVLGEKVVFEHYKSLLEYASPILKVPFKDISVNDIKKVGM